MSFALFLALNAVLFLRPEELFPALAGARLYLVTIIPCVATALPQLTARLRPEALRRQPVGVCVIGLWLAGFLSHFFFHYRPDDALDFLGEFGKVVLYYFLFVSVVDSPRRFRLVAGWLVICITASSTLAVLDYTGTIRFEGIEQCPQREFDPATGETTVLMRLCSSGIFSDPNDFSVVLAFGLLTAVYLFVSGSGAGRIAWLLPVSVMGYAFTLTHSRGGMLSLAAGVAAWLFARFGGRRAAPLAVVAVACLLAIVGGRSAEIEGGGTAHERLMLWAEGLHDLIGMPTYLVPGLGIGYSLEEFGHVSHNSFVNAYVETGLLGGGCFLAAFFVVVRLAYRAGRDGQLEPWAMLARPFLFAAVVAFAAGMYSLSRQFSLSTYVLFGLATSYVELTGAQLPGWDTISGMWYRRVALLSLAGLVALKLLTQGMGVLGV